MKKIIIFIIAALFPVISNAQGQAQEQDLSGYLRVGSQESVEKPVQECKDALNTPVEKNDFAKSYFQADFNNTGKEDLIFVCRDGNKLFLKFAEGGKKIKFSKELEIPDPAFFTTQNYVVMLRAEKDFNGDKLRIFEIRGFINDDGRSITQIAYPLFRNGQLQDILYGYHYAANFMGFAKEKDGSISDPKMYGFEKSLGPAFEDVGSGTEKDYGGTFLSLYEYETAPVSIEFKTSTGKDVGFGNIFNDVENKKLKKVYIWEKKGLREIYPEAKTDYEKH